MRRVITAALLLLAPVSFAQPGAAELEGLLERGLYNSAAYVTGPAAAEAWPDDRRVLYLYGLALYLAGDTAGARTQLDLLLADGGPQGADEERLTGLVLAAENSLAQALPLLRSAAEASGNYEYVIDWARAAWAAYDLEQALEAFEAAAATPAGSREPWPFLDAGRIHLALGGLDEAEAALERAIEVYETYDTGVTLPSPAYVEAFHLLGMVYEERARLTGGDQLLMTAANHYRSALVGDPNHGPSLRALERLETAD